MRELAIAIAVAGLAIGARLAVAGRYTMVAAGFSSSVAYRADHWSDEVLICSAGGCWPAKRLPPQ
jgi:hypothetical protein